MSRRTIWTNLMHLFAPSPTLSPIPSRIGQRPSAARWAIGGLVWLLASGLLLPVVAAADEELEVFLRLPKYGEALYGDVEVGADVYPEEAEIDRVEFYLDDRLVGIDRSRPFEQVVDAGQENVKHVFMVQVYAADGRIARSSVPTPSTRTDEVVEIELQQLYVAVENPDGERVLDLPRDDFTIFDNGVEQEIVTFESGDVPFTAVILVDASESMRGGRLEVALEGARSFVGGFAELDQAKLILFADRLHHETPFTSFSSVLSLGLSGVRAGGGTALDDFLYLGVKRLEERQGRRVVVILSDGTDVESILPMEYVRWMVGQVQPVVYWIRLTGADTTDPAGATVRSFWRSAEGHAREIETLAEIVEESGGRIEPIRRVEEAKDAFRWILDDLRNQYVLGYFATGAESADGRHEVEVRLPDRRLDVRTRGSYLKSGTWPGFGSRPSP